jgi:hypothetical protein
MPDTSPDSPLATALREVYKKALDEDFEGLEGYEATIRAFGEEPPSRESSALVRTIVAVAKALEISHSDPDSVDDLITALVGVSHLVALKHKRLGTFVETVHPILQAMTPDQFPKLN